MRGWLLSIAVHVVLLPVTVFVTRDRNVTVESDDLRCRFRPPEPTLNRLVRIGDSWAWTVGDLEAVLPKPEPEEEFYGPLPNPGWYLLVLDDHVSVCSTWLRRLFQEYQGRVVIVRRAEYLRILHPPKSYADRLESLGNSRIGRPRLKLP